MPDELSQSDEIAAALSPENHAKIINSSTYGSTEPADPWDKWADDLEGRVGKLMDDSKTYKLMLIGVGGIAGLALGMSGMVMRGMGQLAAGLNALAQNQEAIVSGMQGPTMNGMSVPPTVVPNDRPAPTSVKLIDVDPDAVVGKPFNGPATEASEATKAQLKADKDAGLFDILKDDDLTGPGPGDIG